MSATSPAALPRTVAAVERGRAAGLHRGAQIYVSVRGEVVADLALGEARPGVAMRSTHRSIWLSATKPLAAIAIAQLWEKGLLELDDAIAAHVPEFGVGGKERITLRHALTHTGGFRLLSLGWPQAQWEEILARICATRLEPRWVPGDTAGYDLGASWFVLGEVVRRLDGRDFATYVREQIFAPLDMWACSIGLPVAEYAAAAPEIVVMENTESRAAQEFPWHKEPYVTRTNPGANGIGPVRELARIYEMLLARGHWRERRLLSSQTVDAMTTRQRAGLYDKTFRCVLDWGLGLILNSQQYAPPAGPEGAPIVPYGYGRHASRRTFGHSGRRSSAAFADPEHGLAIAFALNGIPDESNHDRRARAFTESIYEDLGLATPLPA